MGLSRWRPTGGWALALAAALAAMQVAPALAQQTQQAQPAQAARNTDGQGQDAASRRQSAHTERAIRDAAVADETSPAPHPGSAPAPAAAPGLSYGPVLAPRAAQPRDPARKDPAEVHDEADSQARPTAQGGQQPSQPARGQSGQPSSQPAGRQPGQQTSPPAQSRNQPVARRREAWQAQGPMAPRPLRPTGDAPAFVPEPVPAPAPAPQAIVPSSSQVNCAAGVCTTPSGSRVNLGPGNVGVGGNGRLCTRTGPTVQCF